MRAVWFIARVRLRERSRSWLGVLSVIVVAAAAALTLCAGARRAGSVYPRFLETQRAVDVVVTAGAGIGLADIDLSRVAALPQVAESAHAPVYFSLGRTGGGRLIPPRVIATQVADDTIFAGGLDRMKILAGRAARADRIDEMVADFSFEKEYGLRVGSTIKIRFTTPDGLPRLFAAINEATPESIDIGPLLTFKIVGLGAIPGQLPPISSAGLPSLWMTPAFRDAYTSQLAHTNTVAVTLKHGEADVNAFKSAVEQMGGGRPVLFFTQRDSTSTVQRSFAGQSVSLYLLSSLLGVVALLFIGQALSQQAWAQSEGSILSGVGMTRLQRAGVFGIQGLVVGVAGGAIAAAAAFALSPLMPLGIARIPDPSPGFSFDTVVLLGGLVVTAIVTAAFAVHRGWHVEGRAGHKHAGRVRPVPRLVDRLPLGAAVGVRFAFRPSRSRTAVSSGSTIGGIILGLLTLTATLVFSASLAHLISTPRLWGATWHARLGDGFAPDVGGRVGSGLQNDPWVRDLAAGTAAQLQLDGRMRVDAFAVDATRGRLRLLALEGNAPRAPNEIFVGTAALRSLRRDVGDPVDVSIGRSSIRMTIVGRGPIPLGTFRDSGRSAVLTFRALKSLNPNATPNIYIVNGPRNTTPAGAVEYLAKMHPGIGVFQHELPTDVANFGRVQSLPLAMGAVLAVLASLVLIHALVMAVRVRRKDLAVLKTLGFAKGQVASAVAWHSAALVVAATIVALPLGITGGRWSWLVFADQVGALAVPIVRALEIAGVVAGALLLSMAVAARPARTAAKVSPALLLRTE